MVCLNKIEIEINDANSQAPYLVRGIDDLYWCETDGEVMTVVRHQLNEHFPEGHKAAKDDAAFLEWIHSRMEHVHGENPNYDYMIRLRKLIGDLREFNTLIDEFKKQQQEILDVLKAS